jgi:hypothetical protein
MTLFNLKMLSGLSDRLLVEIDSRFIVVITRQCDGLSIRVYPKTNGQVWDEPFDFLDVDEEEIRKHEAAMSTSRRKP